MSASILETFLEDLPDPASAERFFSQFAERHSFQANKLLKNSGLLSDVLTLASFSPLFATTFLQNPEYVAWLGRKRRNSQVRDKEELLESLARFSMTNSQLEPQELLARFRRRELLLIYLRDIRRLGTIVEITEEISHLADAILEYALRLARQELDNRFGIPLETDQKGRSIQAKFCIVALGKLGSNELNYSSDIDLLFLYSSNGYTSGIGSRGTTSNREYFIKLSELISKIAGGEGGAYRVDLRLRPHGRVGALAVSLKEAISYYQQNAQDWERQTLIRSRVCAGDAIVFKEFYGNVENYIFSETETVENALQNVKLSKEKINREHSTDKGFNVKLGVGGIREIEFIAQALQLGYGGKDKWLRSPHTLISLVRLTDRNILSEIELTRLSDAYDFLRRLEHRLQMENGLQTHILSDDPEKRLLLAKRMSYNTLEEFDKILRKRTSRVNRIFQRIFNNPQLKNKRKRQKSNHKVKVIEDELIKSIEKSPESVNLTDDKFDSINNLSQISPYFAQMLTANPNLLHSLPTNTNDFAQKDYQAILENAVNSKDSFAQEISELRKAWSKLLFEIAFFDIFGKITIRESKDAQTKLAETSINIAVEITKRELARRYGKFDDFDLAILALGKFGGRGMDYGSDLDLVIVYDDEKPLPFENLTHAEFYARAVEIFVNTISSFTREGNLYRTDLRLRPDGRNGATSMSKSAFLNYFRNRASIWELLAYVKIRGVSGNLELAFEAENEVRQIIHEKAQAIDRQEFRNETLRIRDRLETENAKQNRNKIDIKYGAGGTLDVYFAVRFLQLRDNFPDAPENRSTSFTLQKLYEKGSLEKETFTFLFEGYEFLSNLDHALRLTIGRSHTLPNDLSGISSILKTDNLLETLTIHRLNIRGAYEKILS